MIATSLLTIGCLVAGLNILLVIALMWRAIWRDRRKLDERDRREDFDE